MLASFGGNNGHGKPHHEHIKSFKSGGYFRIYVYEKATRISRWLLGFVALRELLPAVQSLPSRAEDLPLSQGPQRSRIPERECP
jgi:hypothetical protein